MITRKRVENIEFLRLRVWLLCESWSRDSLRFTQLLLKRLKLAQTGRRVEASVEYGGLLGC